MAKFGKWIGGGLGWALGGPIGAVLGFGAGWLWDSATGTAQGMPNMRVQANLRASWAVPLRAEMK